MDGTDGNVSFNCFKDSFNVAILSRGLLRTNINKPFSFLYVHIAICVSGIYFELISLLEINTPTKQPRDQTISSYSQPSINHKFKPHDSNLWFKTRRNLKISNISSAQHLTRFTRGRPLDVRCP